MRMEQYLTLTDHALWEVIVNSDSVSPVASASASAKGPIPPKTAKQKLARKNELKAKTIKNRFGGNKESKKMQNTNLKENYGNFNGSSQEGVNKTYDRFQKLISQHEIHDTLSMDDLYNNLKVYESEIKSQSSSSLNSQNVAFVSSDNSSSANETVNTAHSVSAGSSKDQASTTSYDDDVMFSFFSNQSNSLQLDNEDLEQIDTDDHEEMDLKWIKVECYNYHRRGHFAKECKAPMNQGNINRDAPTRDALVDTSTTNALVIQDGICGYDWSFQAEEELTNFALMAYMSQGSSSSSSADSENTNVENENKAKKPRKFCQSPRVRRPFNQKSAAKTNNFNEKVNTAKANNVTTVGPKAIVSAAEGNRNNVVKYSTCWIWRPKGNLIDHISKDSRSYTLKRFNYVDPQGRLKIKGFLTVDAPHV
nr:hypothetical protein [Tanacetum cinerariifolium]